MYALQQISNRQKCMGSSGDIEILSIFRYDILVVLVTRGNLMKLCIKIANFWKFTNFILKHMYFIRILRY